MDVNTFLTIGNTMGLGGVCYLLLTKHADAMNNLTIAITSLKTLIEAKLK